MKRENWLFLLCLLSLPAFAVENTIEYETPQITQPAESSSVSQPSQSSETSDGTKAQSLLSISPPNASGIKILNLGLRMDLGYSAGGTLAQGFSIPSARVSVFGEVSEVVGYRFSMGQTREFSTALLPQMMPVEAFVEVGGRRASRAEPLVLAWRIGMFTPSFHPLWSPDLSDLPWPDYSISHRAMFLSRDLGTELEFIPSSDFSITIGAFNGNGIFSQNTNNAHAFTATVKGRIGLGAATLESDRTTLTLGASVYNRYQSTFGSINYRSDWAVVGFASLWLAPNALTLGGDVTTGGFTDSTRIIYPLGGSFYAMLDLNSAWSFFCRWESLKGNPIINTDSARLQAGPIIQWDKRSLQVFLYYENENNSQGTIHSAQGRLRLGI